MAGAERGISSAEPFACGGLNQLDVIVSGTVVKTNINPPNSYLGTHDKEILPVSEIPEKDLVTVRVQRSVSSEPEKKKTYSDAPNAIVTAPAISVEHRAIGAAAEIALRKTEVISTINFKTDSLVLVLYDNGIMDGDTVSVLLNGQVIIPRQGLSENAYRKVIKVTPDLGDSLQLVMYAENLGSIPPNTGLLIVEDGPDRQEIRFEGDMKKSSAVILRRKR